MNTKQEFLRIMDTQTQIALATCTENQPNVRIVNFYFDAVTNTMYFASFEKNHKVRELEANPKIAFTSIPPHGNEHVKAKGTVKKSGLTIFDVADGFINKIPEYRTTIEQAGKHLILFEIKFDRAVVVLDMENIDTINII